MDESKNCKRKYINPFIHSLELDESDLRSAYIMTFVLLPIRIIFIGIFLCLSWFLVTIGMYGITDEDLELKPLAGWRKKIKLVITFLLRMCFMAGSVQYIKIKGVQASRKDAPIMVVSPHSSFMDAIVLVKTGPPSVVAKETAKHDPIFGKLLNFSQPIYVAREAANSRRNAIQKLVQRTNDEYDWPQVLIFPEGTTTNGKALITFKSGAFLPGVPVQPVIIRYPNKYDIFSWTWHGPGCIELLWLILTQFHNSCEIEFLPVYNPSTEEKKNAALYANNVRSIMAESLGVPTCEFTYEDCKVMSKATLFKIPYSDDIMEVSRLRKKIGVSEDMIEEKIAHDYFQAIKNQFVTIEEFTEIFDFANNRNEVEELFCIFNQTGCGKVSIREYLLTILFIHYQKHSLIDFLSVISLIYCENINEINRQEFHDILQHCNQIVTGKSDELFVSLDTSNKGLIKFEMFLNLINIDAKYKFFFWNLNDDRLEKPQLSTCIC